MTAPSSVEFTGHGRPWHVQSHPPKRVRGRARAPSSRRGGGFGGGARRTRRTTRPRRCGIGAAAHYCMDTRASAACSTGRSACPRGTRRGRRLHGVGSGGRRPIRATLVRAARTLDHRPASELAFDRHGGPAARRQQHQACPAHSASRASGEVLESARRGAWFFTFPPSPKGAMGVNPSETSYLGYRLPCSVVRTSDRSG